MKSQEPKPTRLAWAIATAPYSPFLWSHEYGANPLQILIEAARELGEPPARETIDIEKLDITWSLLARGLRIMLAFDPELPAPIAWVYFYWSGDDQFCYPEIVDSWVDRRYRRLGIRTKMNEAFFECWKCDAIVTNLGTEKYGEPFMKASGYVQDEIGRWMLTRAAWEERRTRK